MLSKVLHLNFEGSRDARAREKIPTRLLSHILVKPKDMSGGDVGDAFPLPPPPHHDPRARLKKARELEASGSSCNTPNYTLVVLCHV